MAGWCGCALGRLMQRDAFERHLRAAVPIEEVGAAYGPRCAAMFGFMPSHPKRVRHMPTRAFYRARVKSDERQMEIPV